MDSLRPPFLLDQPCLVALYRLPPEDERSLGRVEHGKWRGGFQPDAGYSARDERRLMMVISVLVAGHVAECMLERKQTSPGAGPDFLKAYSLVGNVSGSDDEVQALVDLLLIRVRNELSMPTTWAAVQALAAALLEESEIGGRRAKRIIQTAIRAELRSQR